jgi:nucleoid-associated protein YgaU
MANSQSIINILGTTVYPVDGNTIINIFNKIDLTSIKNNINYYNQYQVTNEDRWDLISQKFYGTPNLWWLLAAFNGVKDPFADLQTLNSINIIKQEIIPTVLLLLKGYTQ